MDTFPRRVAKIRRAGRRIFGGGWLRRRLNAAGSKRIAAIFKNNITRGRVEMTFPGGFTGIFEGREDGPVARVFVHRWRAIWRFALGGTLGMARGYIEKDWTTPDLVSVVELGAANTGSLRTTLKGMGWIRALQRWRHLRRANSPRGSRKNITFHYDLGNAFYGQWLDPGMTYSSAIFTGDNRSLEEAQKEKYRRLLDLLEVRPGERILEIGCGWGGFAEYAAKERGARVVGITLSHEQVAFARKRIARAGLENQVSIRYRDYREVDETFDHVVSIEMFEAVGEKYWESYFAKIYAALKPGGRAALQVITIDSHVFEEYRKGVDFIQAYIFPGGMLPSLDALKREVERAGLVWLEANSFGPQYVRTLGLWRERFDVACKSNALGDDFDETFRRIWTYYLSYCEGGFRGGSIDVYQVCFTRRE
ncbi:MAG: class I SAM-dependent methyltransferase [Proteobacteria bacterium]|nr:class I SAM-dependent methyltransferase [Pseudomonadota bacterium]